MILAMKLIVLISAVISAIFKTSPPVTENPNSLDQ